ncbi:MAG: hypothetical protein ACIAQU_07685 [Phycisphaerales bacterium JB064]
MLIFMFYAVAVWYGAVRWRRTWLGFVWVTCGVLGVVGVIQFHKLLSTWTSYDIYLPVLQTLLWSYVLLVGSVGFFIAFIPQARPAWCCERCRYDLTGVPGFSDCCPECGHEFDVATAQAAERRARSIVHAPVPSGPARAPRDMASVLGHTSLSHNHQASTSNQPPHAAREQDQQRHAEHEAPSQS